jgi:hypothetical protein
VKSREGGGTDESRILISFFRGEKKKMEKKVRTVGEEIEKYLSEYRHADELGRNVKRTIATLEAFKWECIFRGIKEIDGD